jgi:hypothetical protein
MLRAQGLTDAQIDALPKKRSRKQKSPVKRKTKPRGKKDAVEDTPVVHTRHTAWLVRKHRLDDGPLTVIEFIAHDSPLQFMSLNYVQADIFKGKPPCPQLPNDRT